jgi:hypothetical protein
VSAVAVVLAVTAPLTGPSIDTTPDLTPIALVEYVSTPDAPDPPPPSPVTVPSEATLSIETVASVVTPKPPPPPVVQQPVAQPGIDHTAAIARAKAAPNGQLPGDALCGLSFSSGLLRCDASAALEAAVADGMPAVQLTSTYRSISDQIAVKASRGAWAAKPGTSNHGHGIAIDAPEPARSWLHRHGAAYGWVNPAWAQPGGAKPEAWHYEFAG